MSLNLQLTFLDSGYYAVLFIAFLYICSNLTIITVEHYLEVVHHSQIYTGR